MKSQHNGFSLLELAIVLTIVGLLVGSVFFGKDLIHNAQLRGDISEKEKINTAALTFRAKYNCLPGDCTNASSILSDAQNGDGNGIIAVMPEPNVGIPSFGGTEYAYFNDHLARAQLINLAPFDSASYGCCVDESHGAGVVIPALKSNPSWGILVACPQVYASTEGCNYALLGVRPTADAWFNSSGPSGSNEGAYTPLEAYYIDSKTDDGLPFSGNVISPKLSTWDDGNGHGMFNYLPTPASNDSCVSNATNNPYNTSEIVDDGSGRFDPGPANTKLCALRVKMAF